MFSKSLCLSTHKYLYTGLPTEPLCKSSFNNLTVFRNSKYLRMETREMPTFADTSSVVNIPSKVRIHFQTTAKVFLSKPLGRVTTGSGFIQFGLFNDFLVFNNMIAFQIIVESQIKAFKFKGFDNVVNST